MPGTTHPRAAAAFFWSLSREAHECVDRPLAGRVRRYETCTKYVKKTLKGDHENGNPLRRRRGGNHPFLCARHCGYGLWLWMLVDALTNEPDTNQKILWFLVIFFLHFIGAIVYLVVRKGENKSSPNVG